MKKADLKNAAEKKSRKTVIAEIKGQGIKLILENPELCAQFLHDYVKLDIVKNIRPEQIEDVSECFITLWDEERESDGIPKLCGADWNVGHIWQIHTGLPL